MKSRGSTEEGRLYHIQIRLLVPRGELQKLDGTPGLLVRWVEHGAAGALMWMWLSDGAKFGEICECCGYRTQSSPGAQRGC